MNPVRDFITGLKAAPVNRIPFAQYGTGGWWAATPQRLDMRALGDGLGNSAVFATVASLGRAYAEPTIREYERIDSEWQIVEDSFVAELLADPNPHIETELMFAYEVAAIASTGSAFYHKTRDGLGQIMELWPLYPSYMRPDTTTDDFLTHWLYQVPGAMEVRIPVEDVVQRRWQIDRRDHRLGWSPLKEILIEILQDQEAAKFSTALLTNLGVPGVVLSPADTEDPGPADPAAISADFQARFSGENRGRPFVSNRSLKVDIVSFNPDQMDLTALRRVPEERITAALGWPAILVGLGAGLTATSGTGEAGTIREFATEQSLIPMWGAGGKQWTNQLLYDPAYGPKNTKRQLRFDLSEVRALQKDEDDLVKRLDMAIQGGWATVAEGRRAINLPVLPVHDVFLRAINKEAINETEDATIEVDATVGVDDGDSFGAA